jgi:hypothetical protein
MPRIPVLALIAELGLTTARSAEDDLGLFIWR